MILVPLMTNKAIGILGEQLATKFLQTNGYTILHTNFRTRKGEIDIVALLNNILTFVEVKTRKNKIFGRASEAVTLSKQKVIRLVATCYMQKYFQSEQCLQFDVLEVYLQADNSLNYINHIPQAF